MELFEHCRGCSRYLRSCSGMSKEVCEQHNLRVPITNADRIRAMTDEELANKISGIELFALTCGGGWPPEKWLDWLRQEVNDGKEEKEENKPAK